MSRSLCLVLAAMVGLTFLWPSATEAFAYTANGPVRVELGQGNGVAQRFLAPQTPQTVTNATKPGNRSLSFTLGGIAVAIALAAGVAVRRSAAAVVGRHVPATFVPLGSLYATPGGTVRETLIACHAELREAGQPSVPEVDAQMEELAAIAKQAVAGAAAVVIFTGSFAQTATAYPIYAQQNYKYPVEPTGRLVCANCHLASKPLDVKAPHDVLPDTIFKIIVDIPAKYEKRRQLDAAGEKVPLNVGAIAVMPEGWKLAPRDRLPKVIKKEMKGLAWSPYSKEYPNIVVAGPVPGEKYSSMTLPVLAPMVDGKTVYFDKVAMQFGGNRGRGQVYPEGNNSNNNVYTAKDAGTIKSIEGDNTKRTVTIETKDGATITQELLAGADVIVKEGEVVKRDQQLTTNPNVGGFGQEEKEIVLQDVNRVNAVQAVMASIFIAQLTFVLKKKQFEKVQLAEGF